MQSFTQPWVKNKTPLWSVVNGAPKVFAEKTDKTNVFLKLLGAQITEPGYVTVS